MSYILYLMSNPIYSYISNIYDLVVFYGMSTTVGCLMPNRLIYIYIYIYIKCIRFGLVEFYGISNIVGYSMPNPLYTYVLNVYDLFCLGFMAYQTLSVI